MGARISKRQAPPRGPTFWKVWDVERTARAIEKWLRDEDGSTVGASVPDFDKELAALVRSEPAEEGTGIPHGKTSAGQPMFGLDDAVVVAAAPDSLDKAPRDLLIDVLFACALYQSLVRLEGARMAVFENATKLAGILRRKAVATSVREFSGSVRHYRRVQKLLQQSGTNPDERVAGTAFKMEDAVKIADDLRTVVEALQSLVKRLTGPLGGGL